MPVEIFTNPAKYCFSLNSSYFNLYKNPAGGFLKATIINTILVTNTNYMHKGRVEAFSDGVIAIIITIMVLEMKVPHSTDVLSLKPLIPVFISYALSFVYVGIYWNNHHHMMAAVNFIDGSILWANLHLLFWLSLIPFVTSWMGENHFAQWPVTLYGFVLLMNALAYSILSGRLIRIHGKDSPLGTAIGNGNKGKASVAVYVLALLLSFVNSNISFGLYVIVAGIWFIPDKRIEKKIEHEKKM